MDAGLSHAKKLGNEKEGKEELSLEKTKTTPDEREDVECWRVAPPSGIPHYRFSEPATAVVRPSKM